MNGTVPSGAVVPIHSHTERETFYVLRGQLDALKEDRWLTYGPGSVFDVPGGVKHAWRNVSSESALMLVVTTMPLARFLQRVGRPVASIPPGAPSAEALQQFAQASLAEGHWLGGIADNAAIGISLFSFN
jgi:uncharacterized RmlC-like cupin family protein